MKSYYLTKEVLENFEKNGFIYYQVQKEIFNLFLEKKLSETAFKIYVLLFDRAKVSLKNDYYDEKGIYVYYTYNQLKEKLGVGNTPISNGLKNLVELCLVEKKVNFDNGTKFYIGYLKDK